ncbi:MAG: hypothetical protein ACFFEY_14960 [Candidatus Thorarchaeota archaeon]
MSKQGILFLIARELRIQERDQEIDAQFYAEIERQIDYEAFTIPIKKLRMEWSILC